MIFGSGTSPAYAVDIPKFEGHDGERDFSKSLNEFGVLVYGGEGGIRTPDPGFARITA
jgi:hypothetical protein